MGRYLKQLLLPPLISGLGVVLGCGLAACDGRHDIPDLLAEARVYHQKGEDKAAIIQLKNVLQQNANNVEARALLGQVYLDTGDAPSAEKELRKAQSLGLPRAELMPPLGKALLMSGQFNQVLAEIRLDRSDRGQAAMLAVRAEAFLALGDIEQAKYLFALALYKQRDLVPALLGLARMDSAAGLPGAAGPLVQRALSAHPNDIDSLRLQASLLKQQGKTEDARRVYGHIIGLRPEGLNARIDLANLDIATSRLDHARADLDGARKIAPASLAVVQTQALLDFRQGKHKAALAGLQQVLRAVPEHMPSILLMGAVQLALGSPELARQSLQRYLDANPGHAAASKMLASIAKTDGKPDAALKILVPLLYKDGDDVALLSMTGEARMNAGRFGEAATDFEKASALAPEQAKLHTALAISRLGTGDEARAISELERAIALDSKDDQAGVLLVMTYLRGKNYDKALAAVDAMLLKQPDNPAAHNLKGGVMLLRHDPAAARTSFDKALGLNPLYTPTLENLTQLDLSDNKAQAAKQRLLASLSRDPKNAAVMAMLSRLASNEGQKDEARHWLEVAVKENPDATEPAMLLAHFYLQAGDRQKALTLAQKLQLTAPADANLLALLAQAQFAAGDTRAALTSYQKLAQVQPASPALQMRLAGLQTVLNDRDGALLSVRRALMLQKDSLEAKIVLTGLLLATAQTDEALVTARTIQQQHRDLAAGFKLEGDVWMAQNKPQPALKAYQQAFSIEKIGPLLIKIHQTMLLAGKTADADSRLGAWLKENPEDVDTRRYFASTLLSAKAYPAAIGQYETIVRQVPDHVAALNDLAWAYLQQGDKRALATAERAYKLAPGNPAVLDTLAWILLQQGDTGRALPLLQKAAGLMPDATDIHYHLGMVLIKTGDRKGARAAFERLLGSARDFPNRAEVQAALAGL